MNRMKSNQTKSIGTSMFRVRRWMLKVAVFATAGSALAGVHYVDVNSANATPPYTNWTTAATNIQDAVDAAVAGDEIVVTNGIYAIGGRTVSDGAPNRVAVDKPLGLQSINGPQFTVIDGARSVRCVYLTNGASLSGFTLTNGSVYNDCPCYYYGGGGAYGGILTNCTLSGNSVRGYLDGTGGGAYASTLNNCTLSGNRAFNGGGASGGTLNHCALTGNYGGGAESSTLNNCTLTGNYGGGAESSTLNNCTLTGNYGGGANSSTLNTCTVNGNSADNGGGTVGCTLNN